MATMGGALLPFDSADIAAAGTGEQEGGLMKPELFTVLPSPSREPGLTPSSVPKHPEKKSRGGREHPEKKNREHQVFPDFKKKIQRASGGNSVENTW